MKRKIQLVVGLFLLFLYAISGITVYTFSLKRVEKSMHTQSEVYLESLSAIIAEVDKQNETGFNHNDYIALKPYFSKPAFYTSDYPFMVNAEGLYSIHLYKEGHRFPRELLNQMFSNPEGKGLLEHSELVNNKEQKILIFFKKVNQHNAFIGLPIKLNEATEGLKANRMVMIILVIFGSIAIVVLINLTLNPTLSAIEKVNQSVSLMAKGETPETLSHQSNDEVGKIIQSLNVLIQGLAKTATFANDIGQNNLNSEFIPLGPNDKLGNALLNMRKNLKKAFEEEQHRKLEDEQRNWVNSGLAKFADILRQNNNNLQALSDNVTQNLLDYLSANQGGLFILNEDDEEKPELELLSAYAYNRKKFKQKSIALGEGLVGNCAIEKQTVYLKEIPEDYLDITSGLGEAPPRSLLIVPLKLEEKVFGVIEIASFNDFKSHEIEFIEKIGESIASTLSAVKNSIRTTQLLEQSQQQREEMAAQEEEMRQNMEEMQATQEEMSRKTIEMEGMTSAINQAMLFAELTDKGEFLNINTNILSLLDYTRGEIDDKSISSIIHPNDIGAFTNSWKNIIAGETFKGTLRWINRNNEELYILSSISPAFDETGEIFKIFFLGQDVTTSKQIELKAQEQAEEIEKNLIELQAEQELAQERQEEISALLKALDTTCLVTECDPNGKITFINNRNEEVLGDPKEKIVGKLHSDLDLEAKTNPEKYNQFWDKLLNGIPQQREFSLKVNGKLVWISEHYTPIEDSNGKVVKIINIGIDISKGKNAETLLQKQVEELSKQLRSK
jgi:methyl-accepting chemotaxis protein